MTDIKENNTKQYSSLDNVEEQVKMLAKNLDLKGQFLTLLTTVLVIIRKMGECSEDDTLVVEKFAKLLFRKLGISASQLDSMTSLEGCACADIDAAANQCNNSDSAAAEESKNAEATRLEPESDELEYFDCETRGDETSTKERELAAECRVEGVDASKVPGKYQENAERRENKEEHCGADGGQIELKSLDSCRKDGDVSGKDTGSDEAARPNSCPTLDNEVDIYSSAGSHSDNLLSAGFTNSTYNQNSTSNKQSRSSTRNYGLNSNEDSCSNNEAENSAPPKECNGAQGGEHNSDQSNSKSNSSSVEGSELPNADPTTSSTQAPGNTQDIVDPAKSNNLQSGARPKNFSHKLQSQTVSSTNTPEDEALNRRRHSSLPYTHSASNAGEIQPQFEMQVKKSNHNYPPTEPTHKFHEFTAKRKVQNELHGKKGLKLQSTSFKRQQSYTFDGETEEIEERAQSVPEWSAPKTNSERKYQSLDWAGNDRNTGFLLQSQASHRPYYLGLKQFQELPSKRQERNKHSAIHQSLPYFAQSVYEQSSSTNSDFSTSGVAKFQFKSQSSISHLPTSPPEGAAVVPNTRSTHSLLAGTQSKLSVLREDMSSLRESVESLRKQATASPQSNISCAQSSTKPHEPSGVNCSKPGPEGAAAASGRLVTDSSCAVDHSSKHLPEKQGKDEVTAKSSGNHGDNVNSSQSDSTTEDQPTNVSVPEPNVSNTDDVESDGLTTSLPSNQQSELVTIGDQDILTSQSADVVPEPIETIPEVPEPEEEHNSRTGSVPAPQVSISRTVEASMSAAARSEESTEPLSANSRRALRAQRRQRQRRNRNSPPEGAEGASAEVNNRTAVKSPPPAPPSAEDRAALLKRFGLDTDDDDLEGVDLDEVRRENARLKNARMCQVCKDKDANRLFLPCAHLSACALCTPALTKCPQCRHNIRGIVSVYFG